MKIGILADTHGDIPRLRKALALFRAHAVTAIVHCGDIGGTQCLEVLAGAGPAVHVVAGNTDQHVGELEPLAAELSVHFAWEVIELPLDDGRSLVATHGDDERALGELIHEGRFPYVCHGHTHQPRDERIGQVHVINPGALHRAKLPTVAVLDTDTDLVEHLPVP